MRWNEGSLRRAEGIVIAIVGALVLAAYIVSRFR